ncbi:beta-L-arabinofuranosidase domain-containing protein [Lysobacter firmicutimachus]|uniref:Beta-L-arabinofuranosidase domain-containing protein n=1 Tax=Lysobacter firmicutimachus TaxID=1792846 RepID=A0ABU8D334_9GAMM
MKHLLWFAQVALHADRDRLNAGRHPTRTPQEHLAAAAQWLLRAQQATDDDGVAHSYDARRNRWIASYPETTGYVIPTLCDYADYGGDPRYRDAALRMARWEVAVQQPDGGVRAGTMATRPAVSTVFNTGQVLFGLERALRETGEPLFRDALVRAADWLLQAQDPDGCWRRFQSPLTTTRRATYNTRTAFGLVRAYQATADARYLQAADRNVAWALSTAHANGWLPDNCLGRHRDDRALTHTIAYALRGFLEVGAATGNRGYLDQARRMARAMAQAQAADGSLPGYCDPQWRGAVAWTCVTGNSQMAVNWLRLAQVDGDERWIAHAVAANRYNMSLQHLATANDNVRGALKGSHPLGAAYMPWRYPNWATKFFMDALMLETRPPNAAPAG